MKTSILTLIPTDKNKDMLKKYGELWAKLKFLLHQQIITQMNLMENI